MKKVIMAEILSNTLIVDTIWEMKVLAPEIAETAKAGQFVNLYVNQADCLLPRPISICEIGKKSGALRLLYQTVGKGTLAFSKKQAGETIKILGPLGNGFDTKENTCGAHVVIGGGIGAPPLLELVKALQGKVYVFLGARSNPILVKDFEMLGAEVHVATDDGKKGYHGNVIELLKRINPHVDEIYACGPKVMLKAVAEWSKDRAMIAQISMEERMACGIGACVGCTVKIGNKDDYQMKKVCKDGPVFLSNEVVWDE